MQCLRVVYREIPHEWLYFSQYTQEPLGECAYKENSTESRVGYSRYTTRKHCITNLSHATLTQLSFLHRFRVSLFFDKLFNFFVRLTLFDCVFLFDLWLQEFQINADTRVFFFQFLVVYTKIRFACQDGKAAPLSAGKLRPLHPQNMQRLSSSLIGCILYGMG